MELWEAINAGLEQSVEEFIKAIDTGMERSERIVVIGAFLESYYETHGKHPNNEDTERLADACLWEELRDSHPDKVTNTEYPFFSEHQLKLRDKRLAGGVDVEGIGSDRKDHRPPYKKPRTFGENEAIERARKKANKKSK